MSSKLMPWACWGEWADVAVCLNGTNSQGTGAANSRELQALGVDMASAHSQPTASLFMRMSRAQMPID